MFIGSEKETWNMDPELLEEAISKFKEAEIDHSALSDSDKEELKHQWKLWLDTTAHGIKDELRAEGKLV